MKPMRPTKMYALVNRGGTIIGDPCRGVFANWQKSKEERIVRVLVTEIIGSTGNRPKSLSERGRLPQTRRDAAGREHLKGRSAANVAKQFGIHPSTVVSYAKAYVRRMPGYESSIFIDILRRPENGLTSAVREVFKKLSAATETKG